MADRYSPAFPFQHNCMVEGLASNGMTFRDYLAAAALPQCMALLPRDELESAQCEGWSSPLQGYILSSTTCTPVSPARSAAIDAYAIADAMLLQSVYEAEE